MKPNHKYNQNELKDMAITALEAKQQGDVRYLQLIITLAQATGTHPNVCEENIILMSEGNYHE
jgi:hypothetical protein